MPRSGQPRLRAGAARRHQVVFALVAASSIAAADCVRADNLRAAAAALAMSAFVARSCPKLKPNFPAIYDLFKKAGFDAPEPPPALLAEAGSIQTDLKRMPTDKACSQLWSHFGTGGTSAPGLLETVQDAQ